MAAGAGNGGAVGHGETLLHVDGGFGALTGVDAAVPPLLLAGYGGGSQQFAVIHAAWLVQAGGVVPFAVGFRSQTQRLGIQRPLQTRIGAGLRLLLAGKRLRHRRQANVALQFFKSQLLIKTVVACNAAQQLAGCIGSLCRLALPSLQATRQPIAPDWLALHFGRQGLYGSLRLRPVARTHGSTREPLQLVLRQVLQLAYLCVMAHGGGIQIKRCLLAYHAPSPVALRGIQPLRPAVLQQFCRAVGVACCQACQRQHSQFTVVAVVAFFSQPRGRLTQCGRHAGSSRCICHCHNRCRSANGCWPAAFSHLPRLAPHLSAIHHPPRQQCACGLLASSTAIAPR